MAHHIFVACVVCLFCAAHLPCQQHFELDGGLPNLGITDNINSNLLKQNDINIKDTISTHNKNKNNYNINDDNDENSKTERLTIDDLKNNSRLQPNDNKVDSDIFDLRNPYRNQIPNNYIKLKKSEIKQLKRQRRHAGHDHSHDNLDDDDESDEPEIINISPITKKFIEQIFFEFGKSGEMDLTRFLRMTKKLNFTKLKKEINNINNNNNTNINNNNNNNNNNTINENECPSVNELFDTIYPEFKEKVKNEYDNLLKTSPPEIAKQYKMSDPSYKLTSKNIHSMCPILLYQAIARNPNENEGCIDRELLKKVEPKPPKSYKKDTVYIWTFSLLAVILCGLLGLVGVAVIPLMNTKFYQPILSFLVALAVGTMTGDALLHLIPHSLMCAEEEEMVQKGLVCVLGIVGFYAIENSFTLISEYRKKKNRKTNLRPHVVRTMENNHHHEEDGAGDKLCKSKYSTDYCYDMVATENANDVQNNIQQENHTPVDGIYLNGNENEQPLPLSVILREHDHTHHGHAHKHGHVHSPPSSISAVAWMIILGDGLHNFTDGMAIGAAFSESLPGGFSTSLAVFCHELPHELGDFAILIKAGMTPKAAIAYNCLTAILSFFGMIFGIVFGENDEASRWMFSVAAGLFIYIALVDMMPEMTSAHNTVQQILLQLFGLVGGLMSMLLIAVYEHDLMTLFPGGKSGHSHSCGPRHGHSH